MQVDILKVDTSALVVPSCIVYFFSSHPTWMTLGHFTFWLRRVWAFWLRTKH